VSWGWTRRPIASLVVEGDRTEQEVLAFSRGRGCDAVLITAATSSNEPIDQAARLARDRARVVMVGVTGMSIPRKPYFEKELTFLVSRSYGPGRYDTQYEEHGCDYPVGYVRWTETRNMEAFLDLVATGHVRPEMCTTHRFPIAEGEAAYELILGNAEPYLGVLLTYPEDAASGTTAGATRIELPGVATGKAVDKVGVSFIGAGGFARAVHLPNLAGLPEAALRGIVDASGIAARSAAKKFGFAFCASAESEVFEDDRTDLVLMATPHSQHAGGVCRALEAGKAVFVEKPLAITLDELRKIRETLQSHPHGVMVGFNRRFSPLAIELKEFFAGRGPLTVLYRCNAGPVPEGHWIADPSEGGRILGEACHFFDFFTFLTDALPQTVHAAAPGTDSIDDALVTVTYADGSVCQLAYASTGPASYSKERVEVFGGGCAGALVDFRQLQLNAEGRRPRRVKRMKARKGHAEELAATVEAVRAVGPMPIDINSLFDTTLVGLATLQSIRRGVPIVVEELRKETLVPSPSGRGLG